MAGRIKNIFIELKSHAPFTLLGAVTGIVLMLLFKGLSEYSTYRLFYIFHPLHVILSAIVTTSLFRIYHKKVNFLIIFIVGYIGAVGVATISDSIIPYFGENILGVAVPSHEDVYGGLHKHSECKAVHAEDGKPKLHLGFIEEWAIVNPSAIAGILIGFFVPRSKLPHAGHILVSTWASAAHIMMNTHQNPTVLTIIAMFIILFLAVWLPCCFSDIVFPMLLSKGDAKEHTTCCTMGHKHGKH